MSLTLGITKKVRELRVHLPAVQESSLQVLHPTTTELYGLWCGKVPSDLVGRTEQGCPQL